MNNRDRTVVGKVLDEIAIAESLMQNEDLASFLEDEKLKRAVCMTVINIGELVKNLTESFRLIHAQVPWKAIAGFRDIAAHKYQTLRMEDVYATVSKTNSDHIQSPAIPGKGRQGTTFATMGG